MNSPLTPVIHINGTPGKTLVEGWTAIRDALDEALLKTRQLEFNARDYYVRGGDGFEMANKIFQDRVAELHAFRDDVAEVIDDLERVMEEREARKAGR